MARPQRAWPRLLSNGETEFDPILDVAFLEDLGAVFTISTNGLLRKWRFGRAEQSDFSDSQLAEAMTGRRLLSARLLDSVPESEYSVLRTKFAPQIERLKQQRNQTLAPTIH